ncbi:MAG: substrate-binding domain-containing protein, partial [Lachnospiraceae bacterium]|nr:substrate-binding domain-containing protein [Lachnospiraceae bacterium]
MKKLKSLLVASVLVFSMVLSACGADQGSSAGSSSSSSSSSGSSSSSTSTAAAPAASGTIKVGVVNNPPSESGYREANVKDMENVFSAANGYDLKTFYSLKNDEQLQAAQGFITEGVDYLLISAAETTGWDEVLKKAQEAGIKVYLFDRMIDVDENLYEAAVVSDMAKEGETAVNWLLDQKLDVYNVIHIQGAMGSDAQIGRTGALDA